MLMGLGALATLAVKRPRNLAVVVLDNERYGETGNQATHTAGETDLTAVATAAGFPLAETLRDQEQLDRVLPRLRSEAGPIFVTVKVRSEELPLTLPPKEGEALKIRFRHALLGVRK